MRTDAASMSSSSTTNTNSTSTTTTTTRTTFTDSRQPHRTKRLAQLLIGGILCMTIGGPPPSPANDPAALKRSRLAPHSAAPLAIESWWGQKKN
ncbi:hypothetical protein AWZ03_007718 [Drosophila navojoa]|uniref:Uncharacterized protein n=1 Tax=Drosophila navojoa TaxID=7232 RepID=A0A484BAN9_DRONA|nr:hypothetical protein AWZ03_007718 [Drosophila navojoa]